MSLKQSKHGLTWEESVGYSLEELMVHLEHQFKPGMSWDNYGEWHIDHIIPKSWFVFKSVRDVGFKMCWELNNLQPLWARENLKKKNNLC